MRDLRAYRTLRPRGLAYRPRPRLLSRVLRLPRLRAGCVVPLLQPDDRHGRRPAGSSAPGGEVSARRRFSPSRLATALGEVAPSAWTLPSEFAVTGVHHGYRRVVLVDHGYRTPAADPFGFVLDDFGPVHTALLSCIDPGGFIVPHVDAGPWLERWQVPVSTAGWFRQGELVDLEDGVPFRVEHWQKHSVGNPTGIPRVHLVIDRKVRVARAPEAFRTFAVPAEMEELVATQRRPDGH